MSDSSLTSPAIPDGAARASAVAVRSPLADSSLPSVLATVASDAKALVVAHMEAVRTDLGQRVDALGALVAASAAVLVLGIVTGTLIAVSIAVTLIAVGVPPWIAAWSVTLPCAITLLVQIARARKAGRATAAAPGEVALELSNDPSLSSPSEELP